MGFALSELIVYACPVGPLADQLDMFFEQSRARFGPNAAHRYMPHCTLTGFFHDRQTAVPIYVEHLDRLVRNQVVPKPVISLSRISYLENFHGIELESPWLKEKMAAFAAAAQSSTRADAIRVKDWLHLSLAYEFPAAQSESLKTLAESIIRLDTPVEWRIRFYERHPDNTWTCYQEWAL